MKVDSSIVILTYCIKSEYDNFTFSDTSKSHFKVLHSIFQHQGHHQTLLCKMQTGI